MQKIYKILSPPQFDDSRKSREAKYAHYFFMIFLLGYCYALIHELVNNSTSYLVVLVVYIILSLSFFILNKKKLLVKPLLFSVLILISSAASIMYMVEGTRDEITLAFPLALIISSLAFDRKILITTLITELSIIWVIGLLEIHGQLKGKFAWGTSHFQLIVQSIILLGSAFIIDLIVGDKLKIINELYKKSEEVIKANKELQKSNATKDKFFSIIAHDLRSPFQGLLGIANILESLDDELKSEERKDFVSRLNIALKRQYDFLEELLLWGKIQRNAIDFEPEICNLREIVERNSEILSGNIYKKRLQFKVDGPEVVNARCDENLISTVIRNLISNAIKYTQAGGSITVTFQYLPQTVILNVIDNGVGLSEERKKQLFLIESNFSTRGTENEVGTGLGLILCKEIVDRHNGTISVISEEGKGSTFSIQLPINL